MAGKEKTVGRAIGRHVALPRKYVEEVLSRLSLVEDSDSSMLVDKKEELVHVLESLLEEVDNSPRPCVADTRSGEEIFVIHPTGLKVKKVAKSVSALCDEYILPEVVGPTMELSGQEVKMRRELEVTVSNLESERTSLLHEASKLRDLAAVAKNASSVFEAKDLILSGGVKFKVDSTSPAGAASGLYDNAKDNEKKAEDISRTIVRLRRRISKAGEDSRTSPKKLPKRKLDWYEKFRWFHTSGGKLAIGGRDAHSNSLLVRRHLQVDDVVFHADLYGSPFFILKGGRAQSQEEEGEVAQATVAFSSAWKTGLPSADAYWVFPEQVSSAAPSGEFLSRGSFAINGKKNFVNRNLVQIAVGVTAQGGLVSGPESAVALRAMSYLVLRPQKEKASETAKRALKDLVVSSGHKASFGVDDIIRALPAGGGKIIRKVTKPKPLERG